LTGAKVAVFTTGGGVGLAGLLKLTAETAYGEAIKDVTKRAIAVVLGPSSAPTASSPTSTPSLPPLCPPLDLTVYDIGTGRTPCGPKNHIKVDFEADRPPDGWTYWTFATAESGVRRFPSFAPRWVGGRKYEAEIVTGSEPRYWIYVFALDAVASKTVQDYVDARAGTKSATGDGKWSRGLNLSDLGGCHLQKGKSLVPGPCA
jgi:hypothetical protein